METIEAVYEKGVFRPLMPVQMAEHTRVRLQAVEVSTEGVPSAHPAAVPAGIARRKANAFVAAHIGNLLLAGEPELVWADRLLWRVPIDLTQPRAGRIGRVGQVDVDANSGEILLAESEIDAAIEAFRANAQRLHSDPAL